MAKWFNAFINYYKLECYTNKFQSDSGDPLRQAGEAINFGHDKFLWR